MIPKIIHHIWLGPGIMPKDWMKTWRDKNPSMKYILWRQKDIEKLNLKLFDKVGYLMSRELWAGAVDIIRVEILNRYGGVYIDVDSICVKPIENAPFMKADFFVGRDYDHKRGDYKGRVANGIIGTIPGHPAIKEYLERIEKSGVFKWWKLGGEMLTESVKNKDVMILPICTFYPRNWDGRIAPIEGEVYSEHFWGAAKLVYNPKSKLKIAVISANMGNFEKKPIKHRAQNINVDFHHFKDKNFPLRTKAMTPRLQARIVKMFSWQMAPGYDYYLWVDNSCRLERPDSVAWFLDKCKGNDVVVFKHPNRNTVQEEADYLKYRLSIDCDYITPRYKNELIDEQLKEVDPKGPLYASTAFMYKNTPKVQKMLKEWWYHTSRYHSIDQLSLPFVLSQSKLKVHVIPDSYLKIPYLTYVRVKK